MIQAERQGSGIAHIGLGLPYHRRRGPSLCPSRYPRMGTPESWEGQCGRLLMGLRTSARDMVSYWYEKTFEMMM